MSFAKEFEMSDLLALLLWLTGQTPPPTEPVDNHPPVTTNGGGIPVGPSLNDE